MGRLTNFADMTGSMNQVEINRQNIEAIITEMNRNTDQLDSLSKNIAIINKGQIVATRSGNTYTASVPIATGNPSSFLAFMSRSDQSGLYYALPYFQTVGFPITGLNMAAGASLSPGVSGQTTLNFSASVSNAYLASAPNSVTFYYYIFNQPANPSNS